jgi:hypothetical protein
MCEKKNRKAAKMFSVGAGAGAGTGATAVIRIYGYAESEPGLKEIFTAPQQWLFYLRRKGH